MVGNNAMRWIAVVLLLMVCLVMMPHILAASDITVTAVPNYEGVPIVACSGAMNITYASATLHGEVTIIGGSNVTCRGFDWGYSTGNYTMSWNETGTFEPGTFDHDIAGLESNVQVYWRAFAINTQGQGNSTELNFLTVALPSAPTDFTITQIGDTIVHITWTMGDRANTTIIRGSSTGYPATVTSGYLVYSGNETYVVVDSLNLDTATYYYRAWSANEYGYSTDYAEGYAGNPLGMPTIMFVVGLCGFALWRKDWLRVLLAVCIIMWGAFAMPYDIKIAAPLLAIGAVLFFMGIFRIIEQRREEGI